MNTPVKVVNIFISSPGDVNEERDKARKVVGQLQKRYAGQLELATLLWEDLPLSADASFQQGIDLVLKTEKHRVDVAVFILWSRLGSALGPLIRKEDGTEFRSGTEREFHLMLEARKASGGDRPHILAYVRDDQNEFVESQKGRSIDQLQDMIGQRALVDEFIEEHFRDARTGTNIRAFHTYKEPVSFADRLRTHLKNYMDDLTRDLGLSRGSWEEAPYMGLSAFQAEHHRIFFGRDEEVYEVLQRLREREKNGCASVIIIGASGSGKSSLARAGVLGSIIHESIDLEPVDWRYAILTPGKIAGDLLSGLVRYMMKDSALPELRGDAESLDDLTRALRQDPATAFNLRIKPLLRGTGNGAKRARRLFLLVDQLEELFTHPAISSEEAECFLQAVLALSQGGGVWTLSTIRSDFYQELQDSPALMALKAGQGAFDLRAPDAGDIHHLITGPAAMAGLIFEKNEQNETLDQRILSESAGNPEALPLLEYVLRELYETRNADGTLTFARYETLGGVEGALGRRAEGVFKALPEKTQQALPMVLNQLVSVGEDDGSMVRRRARIENLTGTPQKRQLTETLISERLLVSDRWEVMVAHEALLRRWSRAAIWIETNREALRIRAGVQTAFNRWQNEQSHDDLLLPKGKQLAEAELLAETHEEILDNDLIKFIKRSSNHHTAQERSERRRWKIAAALFAVLALFSSVAGLYAWNLSVVAHDNMRKSRNNLGLVFMQKGKEYFNKKDYSKARLFYFHGLDQLDPKNDNFAKAVGEIINIPYYPIIFSSPRGLNINDLFSVGLDDVIPPNNYDFVFFSKDSKYLAAGNCATIRFIDIRSGKTQAVFDLPNNMGLFISLSPDGKTLAAGCRSGIWLWDIDKCLIKKTFLYPRSLDEKRVNCLSFSPDSKKLASGSERYISLWDVQSGMKEMIIDASDKARGVRGVSFSPDGKKLAYGCDGYATVFVYDLQKNNHIMNLNGHNDSITRVSFSPDGEILASGSDDRTIRLWNISTGNNTLVLDTPDRLIDLIFSPDGKTLAAEVDRNGICLWDVETGHIKAVLSAGGRGAFSPDGKIFAAVGDSIRFWDILYGENKMIFLGNTVLGPVGVRSISFNSDGTTLALGVSDGTIRLLEISTRAVKSVLEGHKGSVYAVSFSPDGKTMASASKDDGCIKLWDIIKNRQIKPSLNGGQIQTLLFSPNGRLLACVSGYFSDKILLYDVISRNEIAAISCQCAMQLFFSLDSKILAVYQSDYYDKSEKIIFYDAKTAGELANLSTKNVFDTSVTLSPGKKIIVSRKEGKIFVSDSQSGKTWGVILLKGDSNPHSLSPDRKIFAFQKEYEYSAIRLSDVESGKTKALLNYGIDSVIDLSFSPVGKLLALCYNNNRIKIWDLSSYYEIKNETCVKKKMREIEVEYGMCLEGIELKHSPITFYDYNEKNPKWPCSHPFHWLAQAENGDPEAMLQLGNIYYKDLDCPNAAFWYQKAYEAGNQDATERLKTILDLELARDSLSGCRSYLAISKRMLKLEPDNREWQIYAYEFHYRLANLLVNRDDFSGALAELQTGLNTILKLYNLDSTNYRFRNSLASFYDSISWILSTCPEKQHRNAEQSIEFAIKASHLFPDNPNIIDTLAAAYAESGQFETAIKTEKKAIAILRGLKFIPDYVNDFEKHLKSYESRRPWTDLRLKDNKEDTID